MNLGLQFQICKIINRNNKIIKEMIQIYPTSLLLVGEKNYNQ